MILARPRLAGAAVIFGAGERIRKVMESVERHHFWFALGVSVMLLGCVAVHAVASDAGMPIVGLVVGNYLGKQGGGRRYGASLGFGDKQ
jgi:hypothetical protein